MMELSQFLKSVKGDIMEQETIKREIIIKGVNPKDNPKVGPTIGIVDREGIWYNSRKKSWKFPETWTELCSLKAGDRVDMTYRVRTYEKEDGSEGKTNDIVEFVKVIQKQDEVKPVTAPGEGLPRETQPMQEWSPKQTCLKSATDLLVARVGSGYEVIDFEAEVLRMAIKLYRTLREPW
jgi:hypothetical protein